VVVVTASFVPPVIPKVVPGGGAGAGLVGRSRRPPPVPALDAGSPRATDTVYALSAVDKSGRVADRSIVRVLGWGPGTRLDIREQAGIIVARAAADGVHCVGDRGHLHLPLAVRRWCRLTAGDRVLLAADCATGVLVAHPLAVLDRLLAHTHAAAVAGGEAA
jgi:bifunctional DNA-binding transcriptional regulator/antitoxin component of YhaV-PrlF toxin-antitoxin module